MKVTLRMNTLMKAWVELITFRVMPMKIMFPHPSAFQLGKFFFYNQTAKSNTIGGENAEKHIVNVFKPQLLEMTLNWIHTITSSKCV